MGQRLLIVIRDACSMFSLMRWVVLKDIVWLEKFYLFFTLVWITYKKQAILTFSHIGSIHCMRILPTNLPRGLADPAITILLPLPQSEICYQGAPRTCQDRERSLISLYEQIVWLFCVQVLDNVCIFIRIWNKTYSYCNIPADIEIFGDKIHSSYIPLTARGSQYLPKIPNNIWTTKLARVHSTQSDKKKILKLLCKSLKF